MLNNKNYGKYGLIRLSDLVIHKIEFNAWVTEVKKVPLTAITHANEKAYYDEFISLYNNANLPHKKYYDIIKYTKKQNDSLLRKRYRMIRKKEVMNCGCDNCNKMNNNNNSNSEFKFNFDDEGKKEKEKKLLRELEQKKKLDEAIYAMNREKAEAMRERELKENLMRYYYQTSNIDAAKDLHKQVFGEENGIDNDRGNNRLLNNNNVNMNMNCNVNNVNKVKLKYTSDEEE